LVHLLERDLGAHAAAVRAIAGHRHERVAGGDHPAEQGDLLAGEPVRIAATVPALVMGSDQRGGEGHHREPLEQVRADYRVLVDELPVRGRERRRGQHHAIGERDHPHVAHAHREIQLALGFSVQAQLASDLERELAHHRRRGVYARGASRERGLERRASRLLAFRAPGG
jgi:hypothetical protein